MRTQESEALVSVIVLTYKTFDHLFDTLSSVISQDYPNLELIISDDASENFPQAELENWIACTDLQGRIRVRILRHEQNVGTVAHANMAAAAANGEYIKFLSPGDGFRVPYAVRSLTALAKESGAAIVTSPSVLCRGSLSSELYQFPRKRCVRILQSRQPRALFDTLARANIISAVGTLYKRTFFENRRLDESYRYMDDWPTFLAYVREGHKIPCLDEAVTLYMIGEGVSSAYSSAYKSPKLREDMIQCYRKEILPYRDMLSPFTKRLADYHLRELQRPSGGQTSLQDLPFSLYFSIRARLKGIVTTLLSK